jgi:hypothetical protein
MFKPTSRYANAASYTVLTAEGKLVTAVRLPVRTAPPLRGLHPRLDGQRDDLIAAHYLEDPTAFWQLCDASGTLAPDALAVRTDVIVPRKGR